MSFSAEERAVRNLFTKCSYKIPRNQRDYIWDQRRWEELFNDLLFVTEHPEVNKTHFIGSFVFKDLGSHVGIARYLVVDGQQRMATLLILLSAIQRLFHRWNFEKEFIGLNDYVCERDDNTNEVDIIDSNGYYKLNHLLKAVSKESYSGCLMQSAEQLTKSLSLNEKFSDCFEYFTIQLMKKFQDNKQLLVSFRDSLLSTQYIEIAAKDDEDTYTIFEILNARGKPLGDSELLKNYIMRYILPKEDRDEVEHVWGQLSVLLGESIEKFIKHYACHKFGYVRAQISKNSNLPDTPYKAIRNESAKVFGDNHIKKLLYDLQRKARLYSKIIDEKVDFIAKDTESKLFYLLKKSRNEQYRPLLLSLMSKKELGQLNEDCYLNLVDYLYKFHISYTVICNGTTNKLESIIYSLSEKIENNFSDHLLKKLLDDLKLKIPEESTFTNRFKLIGYSHHKNFFDDDSNKKQVEMVLRVFENYLNPTAWQLDFSIEHMLPDSGGSDNAIIGNLIPLEGFLNEKLKDKPLKDKIAVYRSESTFASARKFADRYEKCPEGFSPQSRTEHMAKIFYNEILKK